MLFEDFTKAGTPIIWSICLLLLYVYLYFSVKNICVKQHGEKVPEFDNLMVRFYTLIGLLVVGILSIMFYPIVMYMLGINWFSVLTIAITNMLIVLSMLFVILWIEQYGKQIEDSRKILEKFSHLNATKVRNLSILGSIWATVGITSIILFTYVLKFEISDLTLALSVIGLILYILAYGVLNLNVLKFVKNQESEIRKQCEKAESEKESK